MKRSTGSLQAGCHGGKPTHYIIKMLNEQGDEWCRYEGENGLSPRTATDLLVCFRLFRLVFTALVFLCGAILTKLFLML